MKEKRKVTRAIIMSRKMLINLMGGDKLLGELLFGDFKVGFFYLFDVYIVVLMYLLRVNCQMHWAVNWMI